MRHDLTQENIQFATMPIDASKMSPGEIFIAHHKALIQFFAPSGRLECRLLFQLAMYDAMRRQGIAEERITIGGPLCELGDVDVYVAPSRPDGQPVAMRYEDSETMRYGFGPVT